MNEVSYLIGDADICCRPMRIYSDEVCEFLAELSSSLLRSRQLMPDVASFAFWCRAANIKGLKNARVDNDIRLGRGVSFHIAPANIPVNFAFSYVFALLAGNAAIVRVPSKPFIQTGVICETIEGIISRYPEIKKRTALVSYEASDEITAEFCTLADVRVIWGGDKTVCSIRALPSKPRCVDISFADRYSIAVINADAVENANGSELKKLAEAFYNDTYLMDQNACSSPQLIIWQNDGANKRERFWNAVSEVAQKKYELAPSIAIDKYTKVFEDIIDTGLVSGIERDGSLIYRIELKRLGKKVENLRGYGGYFYEYTINDYDEIADIISGRYQTITTYGIDRDKLREKLISMAVSGVDRIVPIGSAMDIGVYWDGFDLIAEMSRLMVLV